MPPVAERMAAYVKAVRGDMSAQSAPTTALEAKSPMPLTVCSTPKPVPLDSAGNKSAAAVPSTVSAIAVKRPAKRNIGTKNKKSDVRKAVLKQVKAARK